MKTLTKVLLATAGVAILHKLGFRPFDSLKAILGQEDSDELPDMTLWLIPTELRNDIPDGVQLTSIFGDTLETGTKRISADARFGCLAYGVLREDAETNEFLATLPEPEVIGAENWVALFPERTKHSIYSYYGFEALDYKSNASCGQRANTGAMIMIAIEAHNEKPTGRKAIQIEPGSIKAFGPRNKSMSDAFNTGLIESKKVDKAYTDAGLVVVLLPALPNTEGKRRMAIGFANDIRLVVPMAADENAKGALSVGDLIVLANTLRDMPGEPLASIRSATEAYIATEAEEFGVYMVNTSDTSTKISVDDLASGDYKILNFQGMQRFAKLEKKFSKKEDADALAKELTKSGDPKEVFRVAPIRNDM